MNPALTVRDPDKIKVQTAEQRFILAGVVPSARHLASAYRKRQGRKAQATLGVVVNQVYLNAITLKVDEVQTVDELVSGNFAAGVWMAGFSFGGWCAGQQGFFGRCDLGRLT
jgi:hypothetical protein